MAAQADFHPIFWDGGRPGPSFTYLLAPPVVGLPLRPPPAPCCAAENCLQNQPLILTWLIEGPNGQAQGADCALNKGNAWGVSANFFLF